MIRGFDFLLEIILFALHKRIYAFILNNGVDKMTLRKIYFIYKNKMSCY